MAYYVITVQLFDNSIQHLVLVLDSNYGLFDQVANQINCEFRILSIDSMGTCWPWR